MEITTLVDIKKNPNIPLLTPGDTVKVSVKVIEGERERIQVFQGVVIKVQEGITGNFTVRRVAYGTGTERTFPFNSPLIDKVEVTRHGKVRRAKLFYLRGLTTKKARLKERRVTVKPETGTAEETSITTETSPSSVPEVQIPQSTEISTSNESSQVEGTTAEKEQAGPESEIKTE